MKFNWDRYIYWVASWVSFCSLDCLDIFGEIIRPIEIDSIELIFGCWVDILIKISFIIKVDLFIGIDGVLLFFILLIVMTYVWVNLWWFMGITLQTVGIVTVELWPLLIWK